MGVGVSEGTGLKRESKDRKSDNDPIDLPRTNPLRDDRERGVLASFTRSLKYRSVFRNRLPVGRKRHFLYDRDPHGEATTSLRVRAAAYVLRQAVTLEERSCQPVENRFTDFEQR